MHYFLKYKTLIFRTVGVLMLAIGFVIFFWKTPKAGVSENEIAAANVARLEARASGSSSASSPAKPDTSKILEKFKETRESQVKYFMILVMIAGAGFVLYSFLKKEQKKPL